MNLSLREWHELAELQRAAHTALHAIETRIANMVLDHKSDAAAVAFLMDDLLPCVDSASSDLTRYDCSPVSEWVGNDRKGDGIWRWREPQFLYRGSSRRYFTEEEVAEYSADKQARQVSGQRADAASHD